MSWQEQAVCRHDPELWFTATARALAMHICRSHCPVVAQCAEDAVANPPRNGVQAGVAFNDDFRPFAAAHYTPARTCPRCPTTPAKPPPTITGKCGTATGYRGHLRRGEQVCGPCRIAGRERQQAWRAKRLARDAAAVREEKE